MSGGRTPYRGGIADVFHNEITAWVVLAISLSLTYFAWFIADSYVEKRASERFEFEVDEARQRILKRMLEYEQVLRGGVSLIDTLGRIPTRDEWHRYVNGLEIQRYFPGIQGIGLSLMLTPQQLPDHIAQVRDEGFAEYTVTPDGEREQYSAIVYLEPFDWRNRRAFGYDMYSNPMRRAAMQRARDTGLPAASGRVTLVQETASDVQAGFVVYLPAYRPGMPTGNAAQRREALLGYVYSPFRMQDLMHGILGSERPDVAFHLYDGTGALTPETLLYDSDATAHTGAAPRQRIVTAMDLQGHTWTGVFHSTPSYDESLSSSQPALIGFGGLLVDLLLFAIIWSLAGERGRVQAKAEAMTEDMRNVTGRLELAQASAGIGTWDYNLITGELIWDARMCELYDVPADRFGATFEAWREHAHPDDRQRVEAELQLTVQGAQDFNTDFRIVRHDGEVRTIEAHAKVVRNMDGLPLRVVGINLDVTDRRQAEQRLALAASVFHHAHESIAITDADEHILDVNPTFTEMTGYRRDEVLGHTPRILSSGRHGKSFYQDMWATLKRDGYWRGEIWNRRRDGENFAEQLTISTVRDAQGRATHYVAVFSDITALKQHQQQLEWMAHYDALTRLPNRVLLADRMRQAIALARRNRRLVAVCYLDLDGFKPVNDRYGHDIGDRLLVEVAQRLLHCLRESDTVARLGGDEFVLLLNDVADASECEQTLQRLLGTLSATYVVDSRDVVISASIGVTLYPQDDADPDTLLRHADQAMYRAKENGRNRFHLFDPRLQREEDAHRDALERIRQAMADREFVLYYQPKVDIRHGRVIGAEALIRWQHPRRGLLLPRDFLPVIEESEFAIGLGEWVLDQAMRQLAAWNRDGLATSVSVNISARHLQHPGFAEDLEALFVRYPSVAPSQLELEVLENAALEDIARVSNVIDKCRALGIAFALDDFGTGYSSLTYLKRLPADRLKIDQSFVRDMLHDTEDLAIVEGIIGLSQAFRRHAIAEGVETEEHGMILLRLGCDLAQGYGIARPMPAERFPEWVADYRPCEAWLEAGKVYWLREDLPLLTAEVEHRRWVDDLIASVNAGSDVLAPPPLDDRQCRFGHWYHGEGRRRYGQFPAFERIGPVHERVHQLGMRLIELQRTGDTQQIEEAILELLELRSQTARLLLDLQIAMSRAYQAGLS